MSEAPQIPSFPKKPYSPPTLTTYGALKDIVQGSHGTMGDGAPGNTKGCWIAEALYGAHDPRTFLLRSWMTGIYDARRRGWPLVALYRRSGPVLARAIRVRPILRRAFRALFDAVLGKALRDIVALTKIATTKP
jgi:hypothetical protein